MSLHFAIKLGANRTYFVIFHFKCLPKRRKTVKTVGSNLIGKQILKLVMLKNEKDQNNVPIVLLHYSYYVVCFCSLMSIKSFNK